MNPRVRAALLWSANLLYDLFCAAVNVSDVASDVVICAQFYLNDQLVFFWLCIAIFAIAQICYSVLFTVLYGTKYRDSSNARTRAVVLCFFCILPFGQIVPLVVWIGSFKFKWFDKICECLGLEVRDDVKNEAAHSEDPLKNYIMMKVVTHGGFMIESVVESVPQSILQMVAIVIYDQTSIINIVSLAISIISVSSRGLMLSYSIHRPTFIFNFTCFISDVFRVFCVVSWLFFLSPSSFSETIFFLSDPVDDPFTYIWWWKEMIVVVMAFVGGVLILLSTLEVFWSDNRSSRSRGVWKSTIRDIALSFLLALFGLVVFVPGLIVLEAMILSAFPVAVFKSLSNEYANYAKLYHELFSWLRESDFNGRVRHFNRFYARKHLVGGGHREETGWMHPTKNTQDSPDYLMAVKIMGMSDEMFSISEIRKKKGWVVTRTLNAVMKAIWKEASKKWNENYGFCCIGILYFCWMCVPVMVCSALFSLVYPILSFATVPWGSLGLMQQLFSLVTFTLFGILILLSYPVYRFYKCSSSIEMFYHQPTVSDVLEIKTSYERRFVQRVKENTGRMSVVVANANANMSSELVNHIIAVLPEITKFAGFSNAFAIDIDEFLASKTFRALAKDGLDPLPFLGRSFPGEGSKIQSPATSLPASVNIPLIEEAKVSRTERASSSSPIEVKTDMPPLDDLPPSSIPLVRTTSEQSRAAELISGAIRSIGLDPQKILEGMSVPGAILHRVNTQYHEEVENALLRDANSEEPPEMIRPDERDEQGHLPTAMFRQKSWQQSVQNTQSRMASNSRPRQGSDLPPVGNSPLGRTVSTQLAELSLPINNPPLGRSHTA